MSALDFGYYLLLCNLPLRGLLAFVAAFPATSISFAFVVVENS
jgi:hypothetical protein